MTTGASVGRQRDVHEFPGAPLGAVADGRPVRHVKVPAAAPPAGFTQEQFDWIEGRIAEERKRSEPVQLLSHFRRILRLLVADLDRLLGDEKNSA